MVILKFKKKNVLGEVKVSIQNILFHSVMSEVKVLFQNFLFHCFISRLLLKLVF